METASLAEILQLEVDVLATERAVASIEVPAEVLVGRIAAAAEWLVREAVAARNSSFLPTTISAAARLRDSSATQPFRLVAQRVHVGQRSETWSVDLEGHAGRVAATADVVLSLRSR